MRHALMTAALMLTTLGAGAQEMLGSDPLAYQLTHRDVTAAVRVASGQAIVLNLPSVSAATFVVHMAPAAASPALALKPAEGLAPKPAKAKARKAPRSAAGQLRNVAAEKSWR